MAQANFIETKKAIDDITLAIDAQITKANELNSKVVALNSNYAKVPSEYLQTQKSIAKTNDDLVRSEKNVQDSLEKTRLAEIRIQQQREKASDAYAKVSARELDAVKKSSGLYNITQNQIKILTEQYNDLATKKALGIKLSNDEAFQLYKLTSQLNEYRGSLKKVDSDVQLNQRNVGNYKGVFQDAAQAGNAFTDSLSTAFTDSLSTVFTDLLSTVFSKIRILAYILPGIGIAGIFSLALDPIFNFLKGLKSVQAMLGIQTAAQKEATKALQEKAKAEAENNKEVATSVATEQNKARILFENAKNEGISMKDRIANFTELQTKYKKYLGDLTLQQALAGDTAIAEERLNDALAKRGLALAIQSLLQKNAEKQIEQELKYGSALKETTDASNLYDEAGNQQVKTSGKLRAVREDELDNLKNLKQAEISNTETSKSGSKTIITQVKSLGVMRAKALVPLKEEERALLNLYKVYAPYLDFSKKEAKSRKEKLALTFSAIKAEAEYQKAILEREKTEESYRMNDDKAQLDARLDARKEYSRKVIELLNIEIKEENDLNLEKFTSDLEKNKVRYENDLKDAGTNSKLKLEAQKQYLENVSVLNRRYHAETEKTDIVASTKMQSLLTEDADFYKKIEQQKIGYSQEADRIVLAGRKDYLKTVSDDSTKVLAIRQKAFEQYIELAKKELEVQEQIDLEKATSEQQIGAITQKYFEAYYKLSQIKSPFKIANENLKDYIRTLRNGFAEKALDSIGISSAKLFFDIEKNGKSAFSNLLDAAKPGLEKLAVSFQAVGDVVQDVYNKMAEASNQRYENEIANLEKQKNISLAFAGDDAAAKEEIQRQYEERRKKIAAREFKAKKEQALFNIAIDTAQAAVATLARTPLPEGLPFLIATLALGAAEAAIVASEQAPQFWRGTDNAPEGLAWTQEKGREIITDKFGNIKSKGSDKGAQLTYLNKGDKVLNNEKTMDYLMFDNSLNSILTGNNISTPIIEVNNSGISDSQVNKIVSAIENKSEFSQLISNGQLKTVIRKGNTETEIMNRRINFLGKKV